MARDVKVAVIGDASSLKRAMADAERATTGFGSKVENTQKKVSSSFSTMATGAAAAFGAVGIAGILSDSFRAWSDLNEQTNKAQVVFGGASQKVLDFAKDSAKSLGMAKAEAIGAAATYGNLFRSIGLTEEKSADMSTTLVGLASDLASFNNTTPQDALDALRSGLVGEVEPLRRFGINLSEARLKAEALAMGLVDSNGSAAQAQKAMVALEQSQQKYQEAVKKFGPNSLEARAAAADIAKKQEDIDKATEGTVPTLDAAQKAQAAFAIIMRDSALAQGDFSRTSDSAANKQRILQASLTDAKTKLGEAFGPFLTETILPNLIKLSDWFGKWWDENGPAFNTGVDIVKAKFGEMRDSAVASLDDFKNGLAEAIAKWNEFTGQGSTNVNETKAGLDDLSDNWDLFKQDWSNGLKEIWDWADDFYDQIGGFIEGTSNKILDLIRVVDDLFGRFLNLAGAATGMGLPVDFIKQILGFDQGGVVPGPLGKPQLILAHGGETILPTHKPGSTVNINAAGYTPQQAAQLWMAHERLALAGAA